MAEQDHTGNPGTRADSPLSPASLLTPRATAIAGFAFAVFSMLGQGSWSTSLTALFWGSRYQLGAVDGVMVVWGVGSLSMAVLGAWLARRTLLAREETWEAHLARAAVLVAAVGAVLAVLTVIGGLVHGG
jgi:uncharacterized membrane protein